MGIIRGEEEVDAMIEVMLSKSKTGHITQSVTFKKDSPRQMEMLKFALMRSESFSGFMKELIANELDGVITVRQVNEVHEIKDNNSGSEEPNKETYDVGNFL